MKEHRTALEADRQRYGTHVPNWRDRLLHNEAWYIYHYLRHLRYIEYHQVQHGVGHKLAFLWHWYRYKHLGFKLKMAVYPNTVGQGFHIYHAGGYVHVGPNVRIGRNCTFVSGVVFGNKTEEPDDSPVTIGDNCYFGIGVTVLGGVTIGNNVSIGAHAVVTHDIPDNAIVGGVPARIIKMK